MRAVLASCMLAVFGIGMTASVAEAALLYLDPNQAAINPGDTVVLSVRVDPSEGECINAIDGIIEYDPAVQPVDISRGQSIMPLWVEEPIIDRENNRITFAGGIPNGYCGRIQGDPRLTNEVLKIVFQVPGMRVGFGDQNPTTTVEFGDQTSIYLNDGRGTLAPLSTGLATLVVGDTPSNEVRNDWTILVDGDEAEPEEFSIALQQGDGVFDDKYYIVFNTTDKQTGIAYYEIIEEPFSEAGLFGWGAVDAPWAKARSPYVLEDQSLNSTIRVKAVDKAGNEYIAALVPDESLRTTSIEVWIERIVLAVAGVLLLIVFVLLGYFLGPILAAWLRRRKAARLARTQARLADSDAEEEEEYEYVEEWVEVEVDEDGNEIET